MAIEYFVTRIVGHISVQVIWLDDRTEVIAVFPWDALLGLVTRSNQPIHIAFDAMNTRNKEVALINKREHNADQILTAIDPCLRLEYPTKRRFSRTPLFRGIIVNVVLFVMATIGFSLLRYVDRVLWGDTTPEAVQTAGESRLLPSHLSRTVPLDEGIQLSAPPKKGVQVPEKTITSKNSEIVAVRHNLVIVLKRSADRDVFTINLSSGHEQTLFAFLDPACPNCRLLEPALKRLVNNFNIVVYSVSVISGEESTDRVAPPLYEENAQKRAAGWHQLYPADNGMITPSEETTPADGTRLRAARTAIDVNNVAFRKFGFAGTPWALLDADWYLPTGILQETDTFSLFLKTTDSESDRE